MTNESKRIIMASSLIFIVLLLQPYYLDWLGINKDYSVDSEDNDLFSSSTASTNHQIDENNSTNYLQKRVETANDLVDKSLVPIKSLNIQTPLYNISLSNSGGGTIISSTLMGVENNDSRLMGGFDAFGVYQDALSVTLAPLEGVCAPCLAYYNYSEDNYVYIDMPFRLVTSVDSNNIILEPGETFAIKFVYDGFTDPIFSTVTFNSDSYVIDYDYSVAGNYFDDKSIELFWHGGLRPTEKVELEDITYGYGMVSQGDERDDINITNNEDTINRQIYNGGTNWVAVRNKYFISALIPKNATSFSTLHASTYTFANRNLTPIYDMSLGYNESINDISVSLFLGPLDIDHISKLDTNLDSSMNFGFSLIRPIGKLVLFVLKFLHNYLLLNYGLALILFAFIIWSVRSCAS